MHQQQLSTDENQPLPFIHQFTEAEGTQTPEVVENLLAELHAEAARQRQKRKWFGVCIVVYMLFVFGFAAFLKMTTGHFPSAFGGMFGWIGAVTAAVMATSKKQKNAARSIAQYDDVRIVGPLAEALYFNDKEVAALASDALKRLLPRLQASDVSLLNAEQRTALRRAAQGKDADLAKAALAAWQQVGDERDLDVAEKLAKGDNARTVGTVAYAANEALPFLRQRVEAQRQSETLLRAASAAPVTASSDMLLRPAVPSIDPAPEQLLRATDTNTVP